LALVVVYAEVRLVFGGGVAVVSATGAGALVG